MVTRTETGEWEFRFFRPGARKVHLVGDFNDWDEHAHPMKQLGLDLWHLRLRLPDGVYEFRYLADGEWYVDYAAFGVECSPFGCNSVIVSNDIQEPAMPVG